jgi:hypothetical protein
MYVQVEKNINFKFASMNNFILKRYAIAIVVVICFRYFKHIILSKNY